MSLKEVKLIYEKKLGLALAATLFINIVVAQNTASGQHDSGVVITTSNISGAFYDALWRFSPNDSSSMASKNYDDGNWIKIKSDEVDSSTLKGIGWFRIYFTIDTSLVHKPIALSFRQKGASEIYLDGKLIKEFGTIKDKDSTEYYNPQNVPFFFVLDSVGTHVIAVRYARFDFENGSDNFGFIMSANNANSYVESERKNSTFSIMFLTFYLVFFLTLGLLHLLFFLYYKQNVSNLWFSIFMMSVACIWAAVFWTTYSTNPSHAYWLLDALFVLALLACVSFVFFIHVLLNGKSKWWLGGVLLLAGITFAGFATEVYDTEVLFTLLIVYSSLYSIGRLLQAIVKKIKGAIILGIGFGFFLLSLCGLIVLFLVIGSFELNTSNSIIGAIIAIVLLIDIVSIPITMSIYQAAMFANLNKDLSSQLQQVQQLSEITVKQEQERKLILERQNIELERMVNERTHQLSSEKQKSDDLLLNILPEEIANELKQNGQSSARQYNNVTVMFTDFVNFTGLSEQMTPTELVAEIHKNFTAFDAIIEKYGLEKIKTIGDAYLAVCGLPNETPDHAQRTVKAGLEIIDYMNNQSQKFKVRIGIHSGPVVAGIVGVKKYAYDIWGDTVNTAARMESNSEEGKINISAATYDLVKREFECTHRGKINAKNKGEIDMYFVQ